MLANPIHPTTALAQRARRYAQRRQWRTTWHTGSAGATGRCVAHYCVRLMTHRTLLPAHLLPTIVRLHVALVSA